VVVEVGTADTSQVAGDHLEIQEVGHRVDRTEAEVALEVDIVHRTLAVGRDLDHRKEVVDNRQVGHHREAVGTLLAPA
jgi:hypothetical protein